MPNSSEHLDTGVQADNDDVQEEQQHIPSEGVRLNEADQAHKSQQVQKPTEKLLATDMSQLPRLKQAMGMLVSLLTTWLSPMSVYGAFRMELHKQIQAMIKDLSDHHENDHWNLVKRSEIGKAKTVKAIWSFKRNR